MKARVLPLAVGFVLAPGFAQAGPAPTVNVRVGLHGTFSPKKPFAGGVGLGAALQVGIMPEDNGGVSPTAGPFAQLDWTSRGFVRVNSGLRAGAAVIMGCCGAHGIVAAIENDLGWSAASRKGQSGLLVGPLLTGGPGFLVAGHVGYHAVLREGTALDHVLRLGVDAEPIGVALAGRPYRISGNSVVPIVRADASRDPVAARLLENGRAEWASVPAFLRLAAELADLGAPDDLVARCLLAAEDEVRHTAGCFRLAALRVGPIAVGALPAPIPRRFTRSQARRVIGEESWNDGWLSEGEAARRAGEIARETRWEALEELESTIAREEAAHAQLGREIARWCAA